MSSPTKPSPPARGQATASPAASRTLAVLEALASSPEPLAAGHLARELGIPRASLYRLLSTMAEHGFVMPVSDSNRWALGVGAYELAWAYRRQNPLQRMAKPMLSRLVDNTGHSGHFTVLHGHDVVYVIEERAPHRPSLVTDVGVRLPAEVTASGLAMLAALPDSQVAALFPHDGSLVQREGRGPSSLVELRRILAQTRQRGHAVEEHSVTPGLASVAMAVVDRAGFPVGAVALTFEAEQVTPGQRERLAEAIRHVVVGLHARLGSTAPPRTP
ncbi:IclR family transcriptional regulator [Luteococcus sp.]|uniref:IclR family transcriptional regulator n=1 Tax=Luteococcus sp. TaxID=1969402 RepID=UPI0037361196